MISQLFGPSLRYLIIMGPWRVSAMAVEKIKQTFGNQSYPANMRRQLWALCCGASIISGFKSVNQLTEAELIADINACCGMVPDMQVFGGEQINPKFTFLTLNSGQMGSQKVMDALEATGFFLVGLGKPRGSLQGFYLRDDSNATWTPTGNTKTVKLTDMHGTSLAQIEKAAVAAA